MCECMRVRVCVYVRVHEGEGKYLSRESTNRTRDE